MIISFAPRLPKYLKSWTLLIKCPASRVRNLNINDNDFKPWEYNDIKNIFDRHNSLVQAGKSTLNYITNHTGYDDEYYTIVPHERPVIVTKQLTENQTTDQDDSDIIPFVGQAATPNFTPYRNQNLAKLDCAAYDAVQHFNLAQDLNLAVLDITIEAAGNINHESSLNN